ncbi:energy transducer TonB [Chromobacterium sp. IIBBL 290-4]|uniref:energy transducer TonB n=1 Tax=Chromobacterium sp. IIBBL 290-4 TaxID=2953890 RepID=UPI0020B67223|nr:energy transducer TonB [Chromobacterium sp. IIBBL 290-4]UTH76076.1 energy transducer TonB [Chromobacterium sp. IIBBL 290-4]
MKSVPSLQISAFVAVCAAHVLALGWSGARQKDAPATPPQPLLASLVAAERPAAAKPAAPPASRKTVEPAKSPPKAAPAPAKPMARPSTPTQAATTPQAPATPAASPSHAVAPAAASRADSGPPAQSDNAGRSAEVTPPLSQGGYLSNPKPPYPALSMEEGETGTVQLKVRVSAQGQALDVSLHHSSGFPRLDRSALATVRRWRFIPAKRGGEPIDYTFIVPIEFSLQSART